jgi:choline dehydrogenase-like flavoprotein
MNLLAWGAVWAATACLVASPAAAENQIPGPRGWSAFPNSGAGVIATYRLPEPDGTFHQSLSAVIYSNYPSLDAFIAKNDKLLHTTAGVHIFSEKRMTICGGEKAWEAAYSHPGLVAATAGHVILTSQVVTVQGPYTYIASYIRPAGDPERADAEQWIHGFCKRAR